jgi:hypothetical protein
MTFKLPHVALGILTLLVFAFTGLYMSARFPDAYAHDLAVRYQFRANHIYILMSGLFNLVAGVLRPPAGHRLQRVADAGARLGLLVTPVVFVAAFFSEPPRASPARPLTMTGVALTLAAVVLLWLARLERRDRTRA